jgi:hypothetical protein
MAAIAPALPSVPSYSIACSQAVVFLQQVGRHAQACIDSDFNRNTLDDIKELNDRFVALGKRAAGANADGKETANLANLAAQHNANVQLISRIEIGL